MLQHPIRIQIECRIPDMKKIQRHSQHFGIELIDQQHPEFALELSGDAVWRWKNLFQIVVDLAASLGTAASLTFSVNAPNDICRLGTAFITV